LGLSLAADGIVADSATSPATELPWGRLDLVGVSHTYTHELDGSNFTLGPIDLTLYPGELIFLIGDNGSGKTTLVKLLTSLYLPEAGEIRMDGTPINGNNRESYREHFSVLFSDFFLFDRLIGLDGPDLDRRATDFLVRLYLDHKVTIEDGMLSNIELSAGQRRRLALLTAYLEDRSIYIFDEWAAGQDPRFKDIFYLQILPELKARGKGVLIISHDDRYYHIADRIIKLDDGRIQYDGPVAQVSHSTRSQQTTEYEDET
jgi:putative ATP-binding cassette transporter